MEMTSPKAKVIRDGVIQDIQAIDVVPGDTLILEAGDIVAADGKISLSSRLQINEALLTGESLPVHKQVIDHPTKNDELAERQGHVFMGTSVSLGTARVKVSATGMKTELGKIAHLINTAHTTATPLQVQLARIGKMLLILCLAIAAIVFLLGFFQGRSWLDLLIYAISLAVAAVPEGMPTIVTVALAFGVQRMARKNALIRKLPSVETLGSVSVICTDKTGTLTTGKMKVRELWGPDAHELLYAAASCCDAQLGGTREKDIGDPTEIAILLKAREEFGIEKDSIEKENPRIETIPFDSDRKRMSIYRSNRKNYVKGAMEHVLPLCNSSELRERAIQTLNEMSSRGLRVLAIAEGQDKEEKDLSFLGLIGMADPPRPEAMASIAEAISAGILPVMITGDHHNTAVSVARELGLLLDGEAIDGKVHARATPEDKLKIVRGWKKRGAIVAMTGDGVNDAPALKEAHIGIAMGISGTQVTQQSADLILADDNFSTIVTAIREGRGIYQNIRKSILYLLTGNFAELMIVLASSAIGLPLPLLAAHLLWINLVTDALPGLALIADPVSPDIMKHKPRPPSEQILEKKQWLRILAIGSMEAISIMVLFWMQLREHGLEQARSLAFTALVVSQLLRAFASRSNHKTHFQVGCFNNMWLIGVVLGTLLLQLSLHYIPFAQSIFNLHPLKAEDFLSIIIFSSISVCVMELMKLLLPLRRR